jgi:hypothetical protein
VDPYDQNARSELARIYREQGKLGLAQELEEMSNLDSIS